MIVRFQLAQISILDRKCQIRGKFISLGLSLLHPSPVLASRVVMGEISRLVTNMNSWTGNYQSNSGPPPSLPPSSALLTEKSWIGLSPISYVSQRRILYMYGYDRWWWKASTTGTIGMINFKVFSFRIWRERWQQFDNVLWSRLF